MKTDLADLADLDRLVALTRYDLNDPQLRAELDDITRGTAEQLGQPVSLVTIVLDRAQLFLGSHGLVGWAGEGDGTPAEWAFCAELVRTGELYVMPDATVDPLHHDNPLVTEVGVRSYAGAPVITEDGRVLGGHCVVGLEPRQYSDDDLAVLRAAAQQVMSILPRYRTGSDH